jgi:hypothetical protein
MGSVSIKVCFVKKLVKKNRNKKKNKDSGLLSDTRCAKLIKAK